MDCGKHGVFGDGVEWEEMASVLSKFTRERFVGEVKPQSVTGGKYVLGTRVFPGISRV